MWYYFFWIKLKKVLSRAPNVFFQFLKHYWILHLHKPVGKILLITVCAFFCTSVIFFGEFTRLEMPQQPSEIIAPEKISTDLSLQEGKGVIVDFVSSLSVPVLKDFVGHQLCFVNFNAYNVKTMQGEETVIDSFKIPEDPRVPEQGGFYIRYDLKPKKTSEKPTLIGEELYTAFQIQKRIDCEKINLKDYSLASTTKVEYKIATGPLVIKVDSGTTQILFEVDTSRSLWFVTMSPVSAILVFSVCFIGIAALMLLLISIFEWLFFRDSWIKKTN